MIRVAFIPPNNPEAWMGGINYLRNLLWAVMLLPDRKIEPVVFCGENFPLKILSEFPEVEIHKAPMFDRPMLDKWSLSWMLRRGLQSCGFSAVNMNNFLLKHKIDILSHGTYEGLDKRIKCIGWISDFQHVYLPNLFSRSMLKERDRWLKRIFIRSEAVLVSSYCALNDLAKFYPGKESIADVLQFSIAPPDLAKIMVRSELEDKFGLTGSYIYVPNQFWAHKNHSLLVNALSILKNKGQYVQCVLTGAACDYRNPSYFNNLMKLVGELDIKDRFKMLGVVPYNEVVSLMFHADAVINPSLFEGWSTTVEEAKAMGKNLILSDIPVHREQTLSYKQVSFFDLNSSEELAACISHVEVSDNEHLKYSQLDAIAAQDSFVRFGMNYQQIVLRVFLDAK